MIPSREGIPTSEARSNDPRPEGIPTSEARGKLPSPDGFQAPEGSRTPEPEPEGTRVPSRLPGFKMGIA